MKEESESAKIEDIIEDIIAILVLSATAVVLIYLLGILLENWVIASSFVILFVLACSVLYLSKKLGKLEERLSKIEAK